MADLRGLPLLVVDDNATNRHLLVKALRKPGIEAVAVNGGQEALDALRQRVARQDAFRMILLDSQMPGMDGFDTATRVRNELGLSIPIILLRSMGKPGDAERRRETGINAYLNKPLRQEELLAAICDALGTKSPHSEPALSEVEETDGGLHILLAEDNPVNRTLAMRLLERAGHRLTVACNGREALEAYRGGCFDVALVDVQMPEMDGFELTAAIRRHESEHGGHLPIIAITAHAMKGDDENCRAAGMDGYVSKPIVAARLFEEIETVRAALSTGRKLT
jgi:CheY-like chemotaxis protein